MKGCEGRRFAVADVGGTYARFAVARLNGAAGITLDDATTFRTADFEGLNEAWEAFVARLRWKPDAASIAIAAPAGDQTGRFTNLDWTFQPAEVADRLGLSYALLINDFVAVGHAIAVLDDRYFRHLCGASQSLKSARSITILGPGTGLGTAQIIRDRHSHQVLGAEGGHIAFAPLDEVEDAILQRLRARYGRASVERVVAGHGLAEIYAVLAAKEPASELGCNDEELWARALDGSDPLATAALRRLCACLGSIAGDLALANGADALVIAGGLGCRLAEKLTESEFAQRFADKGRLSNMMVKMSVSVLTFESAGLYGAAAAFVEATDETLTADSERGPLITSRTPVG